MPRCLDVLWRLGLSLGLLAWAVSCSAQFPAPSTDVQPTIQVRDTPVSVPTSTPLSSPAAVPSATWTPSQAPTIPSAPSPRRPSPTPLAPRTFTIALADNGRTVSLQPTQQIQLQLGEEYDWQINSDNRTVLSLVPNSVTPGVQGIFLAHISGQANLTGTGNPKCLNSIPRCLMPSRLFQLHVSVSPMVPPAPTGARLGRTITLSDNGRTVTLTPGDRVALELGDGYEWNEAGSSDPDVLSRVVSASTIPSTQGIYEAKSPGTATLLANGRIICPPGRTCAQVIFEFAVKLVVR